MTQDSPYPTVYSLLSDAMCSEPIAGGGFASLHEFPPETGYPELQHFVIKQEHGGAGLYRTSSLVPPHHLFQRNFGQPLLMGGRGDVSVLLRQTGKSLRSGPGLENAEQMAAMAQAHGNPFTSLIDDLYCIMHEGYHTDIHNGNIMLDETHHALHLVDQVAPSDRRAITSPHLPKSLNDIKEKLREQMHDLCFDDITAQATPSAQRTYLQLSALVDEAATDVAARYAIEKPKLDYATIGNHRIYNMQRPFNIVHHTHAVALKDPPHVLVERLRELRALSEPNAAAGK